MRLAGGSRAGAWRGCESTKGPPPLFPVPGPTACVRAGGRLAPRGSVMTEPPRATDGRRAEGWAPGLVEPAGAVAIFRWGRDDGPQTETGWTRCGGDSQRNHGGVACASGAHRSRELVAPRGRVRASLRGLGPGSGERGWRCGNFWAVRSGPLPEPGGERTPQAATQRSYEWLGSGTIC